MGQTGGACHFSFRRARAQQRRVSQFIKWGDRSLLLIFFRCSCPSYVYFQVTTKANTRICWRASWYDMFSHIVHSEHKLRTSSLQPVVYVRCIARKIRYRVNPQYWLSSLINFCQCSEWSSKILTVIESARVTCVYSVPVPKQHAFVVRCLT